MIVIQAGELPDLRRFGQRSFIANQNGACFHNLVDALDEVRRRTIIDGRHNNAFEEASPQGDDPLRPILAVEDEFVVLRESGFAQPAGKGVRFGGDSL